MATWRNNDREESKPSWLNKAQKRNCVRTVRGWEVPSANAYGTQFDGWKLNGATAYIPTLELLVAMPTDVTGGTTGDRVGPRYFFRGLTSPYGDTYSTTADGPGIPFGRVTDAPNYSPYFTCPFNGDTCTAGGPDGAGVSHNGTLGSISHGASGYSYRTNKLGVSSLGLPHGATAYIKVQVNDFNFTQTMTITAGGQTGFTLYTGSDLTDTSKVPADVYADFFGPTSTDNFNNAVIYFTKNQATTGNSASRLSLTTGNLVIGLTANDNSGATASGITAGATGTVSFTVTFDR